MNQSEQVALAWVARHLHVLECNRCDGRWITAQSARIIFHRCADRQRGRRRRVGLPEIETLEEARSAIWEGFRDALPGEALLRPTTEELRTEADAGYGARP